MPQHMTGFVISIVRERVDTRATGKGGKTRRTVGRYECFMDGVKLAGKYLSGAVAEPDGPGDNGENGKKRGSRIEQGNCPLSTQDGEDYSTYPEGSSDKRKRAILLRNTNKRTGILIHPASGFKSTVGCLNLSDSLPKASTNLANSKTRVQALIDQMRSSLGSDFPDTNGKKIANAYVEITGEP